jgi:hypothetical protein
LHIDTLQSRYHSSDGGIGAVAKWRNHFVLPQLLDIDDLRESASEVSHILGQRTTLFGIGDDLLDPRYGFDDGVGRIEDPQFDDLQC